MIGVAIVHASSPRDIFWVMTVVGFFVTGSGALVFSGGVISGVCCGGVIFVILVGEVVVLVALVIVVVEGVEDDD